MKNKLNLLCLFISFLFLSLSPKDEIKDIINQIFEKIGNKNSYTKVNTLIIKKKSDIKALWKSSSILFQKRPNLFRVENYKDTVYALLGYDGKEMHMFNPHKQKIEPIPENFFKLVHPEEFHFEPSIPHQLLANYEAKGYKIKFRGEEIIKDTTCLILTVDTPKSQHWLYISKNSSLLWMRKVLNKIKNPPLHTLSETYMMNYKKVEGVLIPFSTQEILNGEITSTQTIEEIILNSPLNDDIFDFSKTTFYYKKYSEIERR